MNGTSCVVISATLLLLGGNRGIAQGPTRPDHPAKSVAEWVAALKDKEDARKRETARQALGPDGPFAKAAVAALIDALGEPEWLTRRDVLATLADHGPAAAPALIDAFKRPDAQIRAGAAEALGQVRPLPADAVPVLIAATRDKEPGVRAAAARSLGGASRAADKVVPVLVVGISDAHADARMASAVALGALGRRAGPAAGALAKALNDPDPEVRLAAAEALWEIGPAAAAAVPALVEAFKGGRDRPLRAKVAVALAGVGPAAKGAVPHLVAALNDPDEELRKSAAFALGRIGPDAAAAVPQLVAWAKDRDNDLQDVAIVALGRIGPAAKAAVPALIEQLGASKYLDHPCHAADTLGGIGPDARAAVPALAALARDLRADSAVRRHAAGAVAKIDPAFAAREGMEFAHLNIRLGKVPAVTLRPRPPVTEEQGKRIKGLIAKLAGVDKPDFGLSATLTGTAFAPLPGHQQMQTGLLADHKLGTADALRSLVEAGPVALPFLLDALGDRTRTRLRVRKFPGGILGVGGDLPEGNPFNPAERKALAMKRDDPDDDDGGLADSYTVTVGDASFVALGQIVGRPYRAVRYIPTAIVSVNSPTASAALRDRLLAAWGGRPGEDGARLAADRLRH